MKTYRQYPCQRNACSFKSVQTAVRAVAWVVVLSWKNGCVNTYFLLNDSCFAPLLWTIRRKLSPVFEALQCILRTGCSFVWRSTCHKSNTTLNLCKPQDCRYLLVLPFFKDYIVDMENKQLFCCSKCEIFGAMLPASLLHLCFLYNNCFYYWSAEADHITLNQILHSPFTILNKL